MEIAPDKTLSTFHTDELQVKLLVLPMWSNAEPLVNVLEGWHHYIY
jgi:hypothetical protein